MGQKLTDDRINTLTRVSATQVQLAGPTVVTIGGQQYRTTSNLTATTSTSGFGGIDTGAIAANRLYYVYAVVSSGVLGLVFSLSSTGPTGYAGYKQVGIFDTNASSQVLTAGTSSDGKVGDQRTSSLTEAQFQTENGPGWILADGRSVVGSRYASLVGNSVPDMRGVFIRGKNNGRADGSQDPAGERNVGTFQDDAMQGHRHTFAEYSFAGGSAGPHWEGSTFARNTNTSNPVSDGTNGSPKTAAETRVKNVAMNMFIKIN